MLFPRGGAGVKRRIDILVSTAEAARLARVVPQTIAMAIRSGALLPVDISQRGHRTFSAIVLRDLEAWSRVRAERIRRTHPVRADRVLTAPIHIMHLDDKDCGDTVTVSRRAAR